MCTRDAVVVYNVHQMIQSKTRTNLCDYVSARVCVSAKKSNPSSLKPPFFVHLNDDCGSNRNNLASSEVLLEVKLDFRYRTETISKKKNEAKVFVWDLNFAFVMVLDV